MSDAFEPTYEELSGDPGQSVSFKEHLGRMDSGELLELETDLREMMATPGWLKLTELVELQRRSIEHGATRRLWAHFAAGHTLAQQAPFIRLGGMIDGLGRQEKIIGTVFAVARTVRRELGLDDGEQK